MKLHINKFCIIVIVIVKINKFCIIIIVIVKINDVNCTNTVKPEILLVGHKSDIKVSPSPVDLALSSE